MIYSIYSSSEPRLGLVSASGPPADGKKKEEKEEEKKAQAEPGHGQSLQQSKAIYHAEQLATHFMSERIPKTFSAA